MKVLGPQKPASRQSKRPMTQQGDKPKTPINNGGKANNRESGISIAPFNEL